MKTVGSILRESRSARNLTLEQVEAATKIRLKFLEAIESDTYTPIPSAAYAKGFIKNYSEFLGLNSQEVLAFYRRQMSEPAKATLLPKGVVEPLNRSHLRLTPGRFLGLFIGLLLLLFLIYLGSQYQALYRPPVLVIESPAGETMVTDRKIDIFGKTDPDAGVMVNGVSVLVRPDGKFFDQVTLETGVNTITVTATSRFGKTTSVTRKVGLQIEQ